MQVKNSYLIFCLSFILLTLPACSVSMTTANISSLKLGKDKSVSQETATFETGDGIYAAAVVSNVPSAVKVKARLLVDDVPGQERKGLSQTSSRRWI